MNLQPDGISKKTPLQGLSEERLIAIIEELFDQIEEFTVHLNEVI